jgi:acyl dehydratase
VTRRLEDVAVGDALPEVPRTISREDVAAYAEASGDRNPLHLDDAAARAAGFDGVIGHGMLTMGHLASSLVAWTGGGAERLLRLRASFRAPVIPGETIVAGGTVKAIDAERRTATLEVWVRVGRDGSTEWPIRRSEAEVRLD